MKVSIIVPFYNADAYLETCCEMLLGQKYPDDDYEIIMIDNNSSDNSRRIVSQYPRKKLLHQHRQGAYAAHNTGLKVTTGDIIAFTDPDCAVDPDWLNHIVSAFADPLLQVVLGSYLPALPTFALSVFAAYENEKNHYILGGIDNSTIYCYTNNLAARASLFQEFGPFAELSRGADAIFVRNVVDRYGHPAVAFVENMGVQHLEVRNQECYFQKARVHAASLPQLKGIVHIRSLNTRERLKVYAAMCRNNAFGPIASIFAFVLLTAGLMH